MNWYTKGKTYWLRTMEAPKGLKILSSIFDVCIALKQLDLANHDEVTTQFSSKWKWLSVVILSHSILVGQFSQTELPLFWIITTQDSSELAWNGQSKVCDGK